MDFLKINQAKKIILNLARIKFQKKLDEIEEFKLGIMVGLHAISSSSFITSLSKSGGRCFEKKSLSAVATAFTGISSASMSAFGSVKRLIQTI